MFDTSRVTLVGLGVTGATTTGGSGGTTVAFAAFDVRFAFALGLALGVGGVGVV